MESMLQSKVNMIGMNGEKERKNKKKLTNVK